MKIMCLVKITCPLVNGLAPPSYPPTITGVRNVDGWYENFLKLSEQYFYTKTLNFENAPMNHIFLFDSEKELNTWANNCRLTDPQLIADQETWKAAHGITFTYEYYSLSPTTGPEPIV